MQHRRDTSVGSVRWKALLVVLGTALLVSSAFVGFTGLTDTYKHDAREMPPDGDGVAADRTILTSDDLTMAEQSVLFDTITAESPVWTSEPVGLLFRYPDAPHSNEYLLELDGVLYVLETSEDKRPLMIVATGARLSLAVAGALLLVSGAVPLLRPHLSPDTPISHELKTLFGTWFPAWALLLLAPPAVLALAFPVMFETVVEVPLNLFVTPFLLATLFCAAVTTLVLWEVDVPDAPLLGSALNVPILWAVSVAYVVAPSAGETQAILTLLLGVAYSSVLVGVTLGWYILRWRELRRSEYPSSPAYWRI